MKYKIKGKKQVMAQEVFSGSFKSYLKIFLSDNPRPTKEVKTASRPKIKPNLATPSPRTVVKPERASVEVLGPLTPRIIKINKR